MSDQCFGNEKSYGPMVSITQFICSDGAEMSMGGRSPCQAGVLRSKVWVEYLNDQINDSMTEGYDADLVRKSP